MTSTTWIGCAKPLIVNSPTSRTVTEISWEARCIQRRCVAVFLTPPNGDYSSLIVAIVDLGKNQVVGFDN